MSVDAQQLMDLTSYIHNLWSSPIQIIIAVFFLYEAMGVSILAGVAVMVLLVPVNTILSRMARKLQVIHVCSEKMLNEYCQPFVGHWSAICWSLVSHSSPKCQSIVSQLTAAKSAGTIGGIIKFRITVVVKLYHHANALY